jgi:hypothetical protein
MLFMIIERFADPKAVYARFRDKGRQAPAGLDYVDSWVDVSGTRVFQVMRCDEAKLLLEWVAAWQDIVNFEIIPVAASKEAASVYNPMDAKP